VAALEEALIRDDRAEVRRVAALCRSYVAGPGATAVDRELLWLAVARALAAGAAGPDELPAAERALSELGDRPDLPEAEILRRALGLRLATRSGGGGRLSADEVEHLCHGLPNLPQALLFRAECWYHFARHASGPAEGAWQTCLDLSGGCLTKGGLRPWERGTALLLRAVARLMLALEPDCPPAETAATTANDSWLAGLRLVAQSVRTPRYRTPTPDLPRLPDEDISVLCPGDAALVRIAVAHAAGRPARETEFVTLSGWGREQFFAISLLRARQAGLLGHDPEASDGYNLLFQEARAGGPDFLLDVEAGERPK